MKQQKQSAKKQKKPAAKPPEKKKHEPRYKWATGSYERDPDMHFILPWQFLYLCKLTGVTPATVLDQFMNDLSCDSWKRSKNENIRIHAIEYFIQSGYGQDYYSEQDIRQMFREMDAVGSLWPQTNKIKVIEWHAKWRNKYQHFWFKKWYNKLRPKR